MALPLADLVADPDEVVRRAAIRTLVAHIKSPRKSAKVPAAIVAALARAVSGDIPELRSLALRSLRTLGSSAPLDVIVAAFVKSSTLPGPDRERAIAEVARAAHDYFLFVLDTGVEP